MEISGDIFSASAFWAESLVDRTRQLQDLIADLKVRNRESLERSAAAWKEPQGVIPGAMLSSELEAMRGVGGKGREMLFLMDFFPDEGGEPPKARD